MELNKEHYTPRQEELIKQIGAAYRPRIDNEKKKWLIEFIILEILLVGFAVACYFITKSWLLPVIMIGVALFTALSVNKRRLSTFEQMKIASDYEVGLYVANQDKTVIGYADRKNASFKKLSNIISIVLIIIGAYCLYTAYNTTQIDESALLQTTGTITNVEKASTLTLNGTEYSGDNYHLTFTVTNEDGTTSEITNYYIFSEYSYVSDYDALKAYVDDTTKARSVILKYKDTYQEKYNFLDVYTLKIDDTDFLTVDAHNKANADSQRMYLIIGIVSCSVAVLAFASRYLYQGVFYPRLKQNESILLDYNDEEKAEIKKERAEALQKKKDELAKKKETFKLDEATEQALLNVSIKTKPTPRDIIINAILIAAGAGAIVYSFFANSSYQFMIVVIGIFVLIMGIYKLIDTLVSYELLENKTITIKKLMKTSTINTEDIVEVSLDRGMYVFINIEDKVVMYLPLGKNGVQEIVDNLIKRGVEDKISSNLNNNSSNTVKNDTNVTTSDELKENVNKETNNDSSNN